MRVRVRCELEEGEQPMERKKSTKEEKIAKHYCLKNMNEQFTFRNAPAPFR